MSQKIKITNAESEDFRGLVLDISELNGIIVRNPKTHSIELFYFENYKNSCEIYNETKEQTAVPGLTISEHLEQIKKIIG